MIHCLVCGQAHWPRCAASPAAPPPRPMSAWDRFMTKHANVLGGVVLLALGFRLGRSDYLGAGLLCLSFAVGSVGEWFLGRRRRARQGQR